MKAGKPDCDINTSYKRLKNSQEMKIDQIPSEMLTAPDSTSLMALKDFCSGAQEKEMFPQQWEHWSVIRGPQQDDLAEYCNWGDIQASAV